MKQTLEPRFVGALPTRRGLGAGIFDLLTAPFRALATILSPRDNYAAMQKVGATINYKPQNVIRIWMDRGVGPKNFYYTPLTGQIWSQQGNRTFVQTGQTVSGLRIFDVVDPGNNGAYSVSGQRGSDVIGVASNGQRYVFNPSRAAFVLA